MSNDTEIKVGVDDGEGLRLMVSGDRIFIVGLWKTRTSKSKKGNMNMSWHNRALFDEAIHAYLKIKKTFIDDPMTDQDYPPGNDEEVPF